MLVFSYSSGTRDDVFLGDFTFNRVNMVVQLNTVVMLSIFHLKWDH